MSPRTKDQFEEIRNKSRENIEKIALELFAIKGYHATSVSQIAEKAGISKGSGTSGTQWVGDVTLDAVIKVANTKLDKSYASSLKSVAKTIIGTCLALGVKVEGKTPKEITAEINEGKWDTKFP